MTAERSDHTATLLPDGKVLVVGGITKGVKSILASAEVYDPSTGRWTLVGKLAKGRAFHTATLLPNGTVLVAGGMAVGAKVISTAELYDPATKLWTTTGAMRNARGVPTATLLANGEVLVTGGYVGLYPSGNAVASAEIYNPITGAWKVAGACPKMVGF
jgi:N-acetylneuraminic acid mutarotase